MRRTLAVFVGLAGLVLASAFAAPESLAQGQPAPVGVDTVRTEPLSATVAVIGRLVSRQSSVIATRINETVDSVEVQVGDRVLRGDVLARLTGDRVENGRDRAAAEVISAQGDVARTRSALAKARQALDRQKRLQGSTAFRKDLVDDLERDVETAQAALSSATGDLRIAEAQLALSEIAVSDATITAPFDGVVTVKHTAEGSYLKIGDPVITLLNDTELEIEADVPAHRVSGLTPGAVVEAELPLGGRLFAVVRAVVPQENTRTHTRATRFVPQFTEDHGSVAVNQSITVHVPIGATRQVVTVHKDAITVFRGQDMVFAVVDGKAVPRPVAIGESIGVRFEVHSGVAEGEQVVIRGNERLRPGQPVEVQPGSS